MVWYLVDKASRLSVYSRWYELVSRVRSGERAVTMVQYLVGAQQLEIRAPKKFDSSENAGE